MEARISSYTGRNMSVLFSRIIAGAFVRVFPGCDRQGDTPIPTPWGPIGPPVTIKAPKIQNAETQRPMTNPMITRAVGEKLHRDPVVSYDRVGLSVEEGVVTFSGTSENLMAKERATRLAQTVRGVRSVVNKVALTDQG